MNFNWLFIFLSYSVFTALQSCTTLSDEMEDEQTTINISGNIFGVVLQNKKNFTWYETDGSQVVSPVKFELLTGTELDSIVWILPGGIPDRIEGSLQQDVEFQGYGTFNPRVALTRIDSTSSKVTRIIRDTIYSSPIKVKYSVNDWDSFTTSGPNVWDNFGTSNILIGRDTLVARSSDSLKISTRFEGSNNSNPKISFSYRIKKKNDNSTIKTGKYKKFSVLVDGFERFQASELNNEQYYNATISLRQKNNFELSIVRYPSLYSTQWNLVPSDPSSVDQQTLAMYQPNVNENSLIGYPKVTSESSSLTLGFGGYRFGVGSSSNELVENGDPIMLYEGEQKIEITMDRGLPVRYKISKNSSFDNDENRFDLFLYDFNIEFD